MFMRLARVGQRPQAPSIILHLGEKNPMLAYATYEAQRHAMLVGLFCFTGARMSYDLYSTRLT
eukprot:3442299-Pyramimonas_sp.AAC.1